MASCARVLRATPPFSPQQQMEIVMQPIRMRVDRVIDFGSIVSLIGIELETGQPVAVHIDHRPFGEFWQPWHDAGFPQPIEYDAEGCTLSLDLFPELNGGASHGRA
jgi:hypothetical protein